MRTLVYSVISAQASGSFTVSLKMPESLDDAYLKSIFVSGANSAVAGNRRVTGSVLAASGFTVSNIVSPHSTVASVTWSDSLTNKVETAQSTLASGEQWSSSSPGEIHIPAASTILVAVDGAQAGDVFSVAVVIKVAGLAA